MSIAWKNLTKFKLPKFVYIMLYYICNCALLLIINKIKIIFIHIISSTNIKFKKSVYTLKTPTKAFFYSNTSIVLLASKMHRGPVSEILRCYKSQTSSVHAWIHLCFYGNSIWTIFYFSIRYELLNPHLIKLKNHISNKK